MTASSPAEVSSPAELVERFGKRTAQEIVTRWLFGPGRTQPLRLLTVASQAEQIGLLDDLDEPNRERIWNLVVWTLGETGPHGFPDPDAPLMPAAGELAAGHQAGRYSDDQLAAGLVGLAFNAGMTDRETDGLTLLEAATSVAARRLAPHSRALGWLWALLYTGSAVNAVNAREYRTAIDCYSRAIAAELAIGMDFKAVDQLRAIRDIIWRSPLPVTSQVIDGVGGQVPRITSARGVVGARGEDLLQEIFRATVGLHVAPGHVHGAGRQRDTPDELAALIQSFKSRRFDLLAQVRPVRLEEPVGVERHLIAEIAETETELPAEERFLAPPEPESGLDEYTLLSAYLRIREDRAPGGSAAERLHNLQTTFQGRVDQRAMEALPCDTLTDAPRTVPLSGLQDRLDDRTVLLQQAIAQTPDGQLGVVTLLLTAETALTGGRIYPGVTERTTLTSKDGQRVRTDPLGAQVAALRRELHEGWSRNQPASDGARAQLDCRYYLGGLTGELARLRQAGKDHLCVVPQGPLHFLPYHMLEADGRPLAYDWIVSYLPSVSLLPPRGGPQAVSRREAAVFGVGFGPDHPMSLPPLPESLDEARTVAAAYGVRAMLDRDATAKSVRSALESASIVHISTHGRHNVYAPAFQTLYLWPAGESDGRLAAHEIATFDLSRLELVTLSACETALGRFDPSDNLLGLPATLLLGGVKTIVGTLWNVSPEVSRTFFSAFHARVAHGDDLLAAFVAGQRAACDTDHHYLEWGAFYLAGSW